MDLMERIEPNELVGLMERQAMQELTQQGVERFALRELPENSNPFSTEPVRINQGQIAHFSHRVRSTAAKTRMVWVLRRGQ